MREYPAFVYKTPGRFPHGKQTWDYKDVHNDAEWDAHLAAGWYATREEALNPRTIPVDTAPPTRKELEEKALSLKIKFDGRTSDRKLLQMITEGLEHGMD